MFSEASNSLWFCPESDRSAHKISRQLNSCASSGWRYNHASADSLHIFFRQPAVGGKAPICRKIAFSAENVHQIYPKRRSCRFSGSLPPVICLIFDTNLACMAVFSHTVCGLPPCMKPIPSTISPPRWRAPAMTSPYTPNADSLTRPSILIGSQDSSRYFHFTANTQHAGNRGRYSFRYFQAVSPCPHTKTMPLKAWFKGLTPTERPISSGAKPPERCQAGFGTACAPMRPNYPCKRRTYSTSSLLPNTTATR